MLRHGNKIKNKKWYGSKHSNNRLSWVVGWSDQSFRPELNTSHNGIHAHILHAFQIDFDVHWVCVHCALCIVKSFRPLSLTHSTNSHGYCTQNEKKIVMSAIVASVSVFVGYEIVDEPIWTWTSMPKVPIIHAYYMNRTIVFATNKPVATFIDHVIHDYDGYRFEWILQKQVECTNSELIFFMLWIKYMEWET